MRRSVLSLSIAFTAACSSPPKPLPVAAPAAAGAWSCSACAEDEFVVEFRMPDYRVLLCEDGLRKVSRAFSDDGRPMHILEDEELAASRFVQWRDDRYVVGKMYSRMTTTQCKALEQGPR